MTAVNGSIGRTALGLAAAAVLGGLTACQLPSAPTDRYAIVIGIDKYAIAAPCLLSDNDAYDMAALLAKSGWSIYSTMISADPNYNNNSGVVSTPTLPTKSAIQSVLASFASSHPNASSILVYYSGHGALEGGLAYVCPYDTSFDLSQLSQPAMPSSMISIQELDSWINAIPAANRMLILDSCYSGGFVSAGASIDATPQAYYGQTVQTTLTTAMANQAQLFSEAISAQSDPSIMTLSAAGSQEESFGDVASDSNGQVLYDQSTGLMLGVLSRYASNGVFTWFLINAYSDSAADTDHDGLVTMTEVYRYARNGVLSLWDSQVAGATFLPHLSGGSGDLVLYDKR